MARDPVPNAVKAPLSLQADYAKPYLYGGTAFIVGIIGLVVGVVSLILGNFASGSILAILGVALLLAGFVVARRGA